MDAPISATKAARIFSDLLNRVRYRGETFVIERGGEPVGRLTPPAPRTCTLAELVQALRAGPKPEAAYGRTLAA